jgi:hypothetical protein
MRKNLDREVDNFYYPAPDQFLHPESESGG